MAATTSAIFLTYTIINVITTMTLADYANGLDKAFAAAVVQGTVMQVCQSGVGLG
jgi:hypothetical protein